MDSNPIGVTTQVLRYNEVMKKLAYYLLPVATALILQLSGVSYATVPGPKERPYVESISVSQIAPAGSFTISGRNFVAEGRNNCWKFEDGRNTPYECNYKAQVVLVAKVAPSPKGAPVYPLTTVYLDSTKIEVRIPGTVSAGDYTVQLRGLLENGNAVYFNRPFDVTITADGSGEVEKVTESSVPSTPSKEGNASVDDQTAVMASDQPAIESQAEDKEESEPMSFFRQIVNKLTSFLALIKSKVTDATKESVKPVTPSPGIVATMARPDISSEKRLLVETTLNYLSDSDRAKLNDFLSNHGFDGEKRQIATLLYFYPNGFILKPSELTANNYIHLMMTSFHSLGQQSIDYDGKATFINSLYDYGFIFPNDWAFLAYFQNYYGIVVPETPLAEGAALSPDKEIFGAFFYKSCEDKDLSQTMESRVISHSKLYGLKPVGLPEVVDFAGKEKVSKVVITNPQYPDYARELYFFQEGEEIYEMSFRYSSIGKEKYYDDGLEIANSFFTEGKKCNEAYAPLTDTDKELFYTNSGSLYDKSLSRNSLDNYQ